MMFEILVLQVLYNLSDDQTDFQISDRLSFMRFLGLCLADKVPDAKTIWLYRGQLVEAGAINKLFDRFDKYLEKTGYLAMGGQIFDTTVVAALRQHNNDEEKADTKAGKIPQDWQDKPAKLIQKDRDAQLIGEVHQAKSR